MRFVLRRRVPPVGRVLLVESGARSIAERLLPAVRRNHGAQVVIDLVTCYPGLPAGYPESTRVWRVTDYPTAAARRRLYGELRKQGYELAGVICSGEPIMTKWKWAIAARLPAKFFIVNENADYFFLDRGNWRTISYFALFRTGLAGPGSVRNIGALLLFPFALAYLLAYAAWVHTRHGLRLAFRRAGS